MRTCSNSSFEPLLVGAPWVTMGHGFAMSQQDTHASQMIHLSQSHVFIQEKWKHMSTQSLINVQGSFLCNSPKLETIQHSPVDEWKNKLVYHGTEGILISNKKEQAVNITSCVDLRISNPIKRSTHLDCGDGFTGVYTSSYQMCTLYQI